MMMTCLLRGSLDPTPHQKGEPNFTWGDIIKKMIIWPLINMEIMMIKVLMIITIIKLWSSERRTQLHLRRRPSSDGNIGFTIKLVSIILINSYWCLYRWWSWKKQWWYIYYDACLFVTKNDHFLLGVSCNHLNPPSPPLSPCLANMVPKPQPTPPRNNPGSFFRHIYFRGRFWT